jgi:hypothetical protein
MEHPATKKRGSTKSINDALSKLMRMMASFSLCHECMWFTCTQIGLGPYCSGAHGCFHLEGQRKVHKFHAIICI